jgi:biotin transport system substrate-specific component
VFRKDVFCMHRVSAITSRLTFPALSRRHLLLIAGTAAAAVLTALATHVRIPLPFSPVPVTAQTMTVLIAGAALGPVAGPASQALFLALGATGITAFAGGVLTGVTGGYLVGFVLAALIVGAVTSRTRDLFAVGAAMAVASALILVSGAAWLFVVQGLSVSQAVAIGILPFIPGDMLKVFGALAVWQGGLRLWGTCAGEPDTE